MTNSAFFIAAMRMPTVTAMSLTALMEMLIVLFLIANVPLVIVNFMTLIALVMTEILFVMAVTVIFTMKRQPFKMRSVTVAGKILTAQIFNLHVWKRHPILLS